jgi:MFS family permease
MSLKIKPTSSGSRALTPVALATSLVLITYVTPMATLPRTAAELGAAPAARAWMLSSMSVGLAAALLAVGVLGDNHGRRRVFAIGVGALGIGATVCGLAREPVVFIAARVVEGVGGAAVLACGLAVLAHDYPAGKARVHATSVWGASVGIGITAGALLSAVFGTRWRESYLVVGAAAVLLLWPSIRRLTESLSADRRRIDLPGLLLLAAGIGLLVAALTQMRNGVDVGTAALAAAAVVVLATFVIVETHVAQPLVEPELLRSGRFRSATLGSFVVGTGIVGMTSFVPTVVQLGLGAGLWFASLLVAAWSATSVVTSYLIRHVRRPLVGPAPLASMLAVIAVGQLLSYGLHTTSSPWRLVPPLFVAGLGTGVLNALLGREAVASVPPDRTAMGSGANNTARYVGAAVGITMFVIIATHAGSDLTAGWNVAVLVSSAVTASGAIAVGLAGRRREASAAGVETCEDRSGGRHGERHDERELTGQRPDPGTPDDGGQRQSRLEHGEVVADA